MEGVASLWGFQEGIDDLKQRLFFTTLELEATKTKASDEIKKSEEKMNQMVQLIQMISHQRDEAREELQKILNTLFPVDALQGGSPCFHTESPAIKPTRGGSSITESGSISDTLNHPSHDSSPVNSMVDPAPSPDLPRGVDAAESTVGQHTALPDHNSIYSMPAAPPPAMANFDLQASAIIDRSISTSRPLPQKGKLLQAVIEAGPLLKTLLVAGPLPQWRNPPPIHPLQIPPVSVRGRDGEILGHHYFAKRNSVVQNLPGMLPVKNITGGSPHVHAQPPELSFSGVVGPCGAIKKPSLSPVVGNNLCPSWKRQKSQ